MASEQQRELHSGHEGSALVQGHDGPTTPIRHERPEDWGWHHEWRGAGPVIGWLMTVAMLSYVVGNHTGNVENLWLIGIAAVMAGMLIRDRIKRKKSWRP